MATVRGWILPGRKHSHKSKRKSLTHWNHPRDFLGAFGRCCFFVSQLLFEGQKKKALRLKRPAYSNRVLTSLDCSVRGKKKKSLVSKRRLFLTTSHAASSSSGTLPQLCHQSGPVINPPGSWGGGGGGVCLRCPRTASCSFIIEEELLTHVHTRLITLYDPKSILCCNNRRPSSTHCYVLDCHRERHEPFWRNPGNELGIPSM